MENFNKGQSALEYLMTYGWALVVIVIAVAALVILINPQQLQGARCDAKLGPFAMGTESAVLTDRIVIVLTNTLGVNVDDLDFALEGTVTHALGTGVANDSGCVTGTLDAGKTGKFVCGYATGGTLAGKPYDITVKVRYGTATLNVDALKPIVSAKCTGSVPA